MRTRLLSVLATAGIVAATTLAAATPAQAGTPADCSFISVTSERTSTGYIVLYPRVTCRTATLTLAIYTFDPVNGSQSILYKTKPAGTYSGLGSAQRYTGHKSYCITVTSVWTATNQIGAEDASSRNCVTA